MDFTTQPIIFESRRFPGIRFTIKRPTVGLRLELHRKSREVKDEYSDLVYSKILCETMVQGFEGVTIDGKVPNVSDLILKADSELIGELAVFLQLQIRPLGDGDDLDQKVIEDARRVIVEAEERIARRKNSAPQSSPSTSVAGGATAAPAGATQSSEPSATATATQA